MNEGPFTQLPADLPVPEDDGAGDTVESSVPPAISHRSQRKSNAAQTRPVAGAGRGRSLR